MRKTLTNLNAVLHRKFSPENDYTNFLHLPVWSPARFVRSPGFELFFSAMILCSALLMSVTLSYDGLELGYQIGYKGYDRAAADLYPSYEALFEFSDKLLGSLFTLEVLLKMAGLRFNFMSSMWHVFDAIIVVIWLLEVALARFPVDPFVLRVVRLARLLRLVRLARQFQSFDSLIVMTTALVGSLSSLFWVAVILGIVQLVFALALGEILMPIMEDESQPMQSRTLLFTYFGTTPRALLTMFELTLGNFSPVARILQEHVSESFILFSIFHKIIFGFSCLAVINGVFMQETFTVAQNDDHIMLRAAKRRVQEHARRMAEFFECADVSGDGRVNAEEWLEVLKSENVRLWLNGMGVSTKDAELVFGLIDEDGDSHLNAAELAVGVELIAGHARSLDVMVLLRETENLTKLSAEVLETLQQLRLAQATLPKPDNQNCNDSCVSSKLEPGDVSIHISL
eukprot:TRINITY_DN31786_c0_g2_i1.p1 TRINITY_DN31786_c0_g2~~TRINITY_DN31786_c0_g2_i1.p1  ORF type:complete len:529 (-),score=68.80 TRINITY_DN31786_c0_g2_i1:56-1423(-)